MPKRKASCKHLIVGPNFNHVFEGAVMRIGAAGVCYHCKEVFKLEMDVPIDYLQRVSGGDPKVVQHRINELGLCLAWYMIGRYQRAPIRIEQVWGAIPPRVVSPN